MTSKAVQMIRARGGSLLEDKLNALEDVVIGIGLETWKRESSATSNDTELKKAYEGLLTSIENRCNDIREGKPGKTAAPAVEHGSNDAEQVILDKSESAKSKKPKGHGRGGRGKQG